MSKIIENLDRTLKKIFLLEDNELVKEENLLEYLNNLSIDKLRSLIVLKACYNGDYEIVKKDKKEIIEYILSDIECILNSQLVFMNEIDVKELKKIVNDLKKDNHIFKNKYSIGFIDDIRKKGLCKIYYDEGKDEFTIYSPKEFIDIFDKIYKDKKFKVLNQDNNTISKAIDLYLNVYGVINLFFLYELFTKDFYDIDEDEFIRRIITLLAISSSFNICESDEYLIYNLNFESSESAINFYKKQIGDYKIYSVEELEKLNEDEHVYDTDSYEKLERYILDNFDISDNDMDEFDNLIILDYVYAAQNSIEEADSHYDQNINTILNVNEKQKEIIRNLIRNIFDEYPKWIKKGNV